MIKLFASCLATSLVVTVVTTGVTTVIGPYPTLALVVAFGAYQVRQAYRGL